jgi:hypothetical protein
MRVYVDGKIYDFLDSPIVIIFDEGEKELIGNMGSQSKYFCSYNIDEVSVEKIENLLHNLKKENEI